MSAQPDHAPVTPYAPAPGAAAELLAQLRADRRAAQWVSAFEQEWAAALEDSRRTFSLGGLYEVLQDWQGRLAHAPAVDSSSPPATTTARPSTWRSCGEGESAGERTAVRGPLLRTCREEAHVLPVEDRLPLHAVEDLTAHTRSGDVSVRVYTPTAADSHGLLVYFHGGAFFLGSLETHDHVARSLAKETGLKVVSVGYRRAPESAFPAGLDDCYAVTLWAAEQGENLDWDGTTLALAGDSSGATFAAAVAARAYGDGFDRITHQVHHHPSLDLDFDEDRYASLRENAVGYGLETAGLKPFNALYLDSGPDRAKPTGLPGQA